MTPLAISLALPYLALALTLAAGVALLVLGVRRLGLGKRPVLIATAVLGWAPLLYVELVWMRAFADRYLRIERPWGAVLAAVAASYVVVRLLALPGRMHRARRVAVEALIGASVLAAALATMGLEFGHPLDRLTILVALDRSRSMDLVPGLEARLKAELQVVERGMRDDDRIGILAFGAESLVEDPPRPRSQTSSAQRVEVGRDATDLASAIRRGLAELPPDSAARVVLVTDGVATRGDTLQAAAAAVAAEVPIDVVPLDQRVVPDVRVVALRVPSRADEREPIELRVVTSSGQATGIEIRVRRDGDIIRRAEAQIQAGEDVLRIKEIAPSPGLHRYDVEITALDPKADQAPEDNTGSAFVRVRGMSQALVLEGDAGKGAFVARALEDAAFHVDVASTSGVPADLAGLAGYDLVVFSDIRASDIGPGQIDAVASYARDLGGGLILLGGDRSFGPGGYARTSLEEVSPVSFDLKQERKRASLAEVISIDYSGSMSARVGSYTKLDLANEAAARSAVLLGPGDRLGVAHIDTSNSWTVPLGPVDNPDAIARAIKGVSVGGGGIYVDVALDEGYKALGAEKVNLKHLLLFSDGDDADNVAACPARVSAAFSRGITTSVVALGKGKDVAQLEALSVLGHGRFYLIEDATRLPAVFSQETILASKSAINEIDFKVSTRAPGGATRSIDFGAAPPLKGYVVTIPKGRASVHLAGPEGDPILATWSIGVGRTAAFTSDLKDRWGGAWTAWPGASRMVGQLARDVARKADDPRVRLESDTAGGELHVRATVVGDDGRAQTFRRLVARVGGPDGFARSVPLEAVGAGAYAASIPLARPGTYVATAIDELSNEAVGTTGAVLTAGEELRPTGTDRALLGRIASMTGGKVRDTLAGVFLDRASQRFAYSPLTSPLLLAAALAFLASVAARKISTPEFLSRTLARLRQPRPRPHPAGPSAEATEATAAATTAALLQAKARAQAALPAGHDPLPGIARSSTSVYTTPPRPPPVATGALRPPEAGAAPPSPASSPALPATPEPRKLTAAEVLLARRRGQRGPPP
jgi:uncharacterized membrane protein